MSPQLTPLQEETPHPRVRPVSILFSLCSVGILPRSLATGAPGVYHYDPQAQPGVEQDVNRGEGRGMGYEEEEEEESGEEGSDSEETDEEDGPHATLSG